MELQTEVGLLLACAKELSINKNEDRIAYGILLDTLLTIAEEGWVNEVFIEKILQQLIEGIEQLTQFNLRFDIKRLEVAKQLAKNCDLDAFPLTRAISNSYKKEVEWRLATAIESLSQVSVHELRVSHEKSANQLFLDQESILEAKKVNDLTIAIQAVDEVEQSYEEQLEKSLLEFQLEQVKLRCNQARCKENLAAFEKAFTSVQQLAHRLMYYGHWVHAIALYHDILANYLTNTNILKAEGFDHKKILQELLKVCQIKNVLQQAKPVSHWQIYKTQLQNIRSQLPSDPNPKNINEVLATLSENFRQLLATMLDDIQQTLGSAPCKFSIMGFGSFSREGMLPYSDLEFALLIEENNPSHQIYWQALLQLFEFKVLSLGEKSQKPYPGFYIDDLNPLKQKELCGTPEQIAGWVFDPVVPRDDSGVDKVNFSMLLVRWLYGDENLVKDYQILINNQLAIKINHAIICDNNNAASHKNDAIQLMEGQIWALVRLKQNVSEIIDNISIQNDNLIKPFSIKEFYIGPLTYLIQGLCVYYGAENFFPMPVRLSDKIDYLSQRAKIPADFVLLCQNLISEVEVLRLKIQQHYQGHCEDVIWPTAKSVGFSLKSNFYVLTDDEALRLNTLNDVILQPLLLYLLTSQEKNWPLSILEELKKQRSLPKLSVWINPLPEIIDPWESYRTFWAEQNDNMDTVLTLSTKRRLVKNSTENEGHYSAVARLAIHAWVYRLAYYKASAIKHRYYYLRLPASLKVVYLQVLQRIYHEKLDHPIIKTLNDLPDVNGERPSTLLREKVWISLLKRLVTDRLSVESFELAIKTGEMVMTTIDFDEPFNGKLVHYRLKKEVINQLLTEQKTWKEKPTDQAGRHTVLPISLDNNNIPSLWWKLYPEQPGTEYIVSLLANALSAGGTPCNLLVKINYQGKSQGVLMSEHLVGDNLEEVLKRQPQRLQQLNRISFARTLLRVLQTNPEDDKGDDYRIAQQADGNHELWRLDNERAFYTPTQIKNKISKPSLQVKSILYCLDSMMEPWTEEEIEEVLLLNPLLVLEQVLAKAISYHQYCQLLFIKEEKTIIKHFALKKPGPSLLTVLMAEDWLKEQWNRLQSIYEIIKSAHKHQTPVTGLLLLEAVQPTLASYYKKAFAKYPVNKSQPQKALERFKAVTKGLYEYTVRGYVSKMSNIHAISQSLRLKSDLKSLEALAIWQGKQLSPYQALQALEALKQQNQQQLLEDVLTNRRGSAQAFQRLSRRQQLAIIKGVAKALTENSKAYEIISQQNLLKAMVGIPFHRLDVSMFAAAITDDLLLPMLEKAGSHLLNLDLSNCQQLTPKVLVQLNILCPKLEVVHIGNAFGKESYTFFGNLESLVWTDSYLHLRKLILNNCFALTKLNFKAPAIMVLAIENCEKLTDVIISPLDELSIKQCVKLETIYLNTPVDKSLSQLLIHNCLALSNNVLAAFLLSNPKLPQLNLVNTAILKPAIFTWLVNREKVWSINQLNNLVLNNELNLAGVQISHELSSSLALMNVSQVDLTGAYLSLEALISLLSLLPIDVNVMSANYKATPKKTDLTAAHAASILTLAVLPDGTLVSGSEDNTIKRWDMKTGECLQTLNGHTNSVRALAVLPNGTLVSGSEDNTIKHWNMETGECLQTINGHKGKLNALVVLLDGTLVSGSEDSTIKCWNMNTGMCFQTIKGHESEVCALVVLQDGSLVSSSEDCTIKHWQVKTWECLKTFNGHTNSVTALIMLPDGTLVSGSLDNTIKRWIIETGKCIQTFIGHKHSVYTLVVLSDGTLASGSLDGKIKRWDIETGVCLQTLTRKRSIVRVLAVLMDGVLISGSLDGTIRSHRYPTVTIDLSWRVYLAQGEWQMRANQIQWRVEKGGAWMQKMANALTYLMSNSLLKSDVDSENGMIRWTIDVPILNALTYQNQTRNHVQKSFIHLLQILGAPLIPTINKNKTFLPSLTQEKNKVLAAKRSWLVSTINRDQTWSCKFLNQLIHDDKLNLEGVNIQQALQPPLTVLKVSTVDLTGAYLSSKALISLLSVLPREVQCQDQLKTIDYQEISQETALIGHTDRVTALAVLPDGTLVSGSKDHTIKHWNMETGVCIQTLTGHTKLVRVLAVLPDGTLASGSWDHTIKRWNMVTGTCLQTFMGHTNMVSRLVVLPDGTLVSGSEDHTIKCWQIETETCLKTLTKHTGSVRALAVLPDGSFVSGSKDSTIKHWNAKTWKCLRTLTGHTDSVNVIVILPDGALISSSLDNTIKRWDIKTGTCLQTFMKSKSSIWVLVVLPDGILVSGSDDGMIMRWDVETGECLQTLKAHTSRIFALTVLNNGVLVSGSLDKSIRCYRFQKIDLDLSWRIYLTQGEWQMQDNQIQWRVEKDGAWMQKMANTLAYLMSNRLLRSEVDSEKGMISWTIDVPVLNMESPENIHIRLTYQNQTIIKVLETFIHLLQALGAPMANINHAFTLYLAHTKKKLFALTRSWLVSICNRDQTWSSEFLSQLIQDDKLNLEGVNIQQALQPPFTVLKVSTVDLTRAYLSSKALTSFLSLLPSEVQLKTIDYQAISPETALIGHTDRVTALAVLPDENLVSGSEDYTIKHWDMKTGVCIQTLIGHTKSVYVLAVLQDGSLASGSWDHTIKRWNMVTGTCLQTFTGHTNAVNTLTVFSSEILFSGSRDNMIKCWNIRTGVCLQTFKGHKYSVNALAMLPDGTLVSGSNDSTIKRWNIKNGVCLQTITGHKNSVLALVALPGNILVSSSKDNTIKRWDIATGVCLQTLIGHTDAVSVLTKFPDGTLVSGSWDGTIKRWDVKAETCLQKYSEAMGLVNALAVSPDGTLVCGSDNKVIQSYHFPTITLDLSWRLYLKQGEWQMQANQIQWRVEKGGAWMQKMVTTLAHLIMSNRLLKSEVDSEKGMIRWTIDEPILDVGCPENIRLTYQNQTQNQIHETFIQLLQILGAPSIRIIDSETKALMPHLIKEKIRDHALKRERLIATINRENNWSVKQLNKLIQNGILNLAGVHIRSALSEPHASIDVSEVELVGAYLNSKALVSFLQVLPINIRLKITDYVSVTNTNSFKGYFLENHMDSVYALAVLPDGTLVSGSGDKTIKCWNANLEECLLKFIGHNGSICALAVLPDGTLVSGSWDKTIKRWDTKTGKCIQTIHEEEVVLLAVLPDGTLVSSPGDNTIKRWDMKLGSCFQTFNEHTASVFALSVLPDGSLVSGSSDKTIKHWNMETGACLRTLVGHTGFVYALAVLPDGTLVSGSGDKTIKRWDIETGVCLQTLMAHIDLVYALAVLPDGTLVSGSWDKTIKRWEMETGTCLQTLNSHTDKVNALAVMPNGILLSSSDDKTIRSYHFPTKTIDLSWCLDLSQGEWQVQQYQIQWQVRTGGDLMQKMATTLAHLMNNRLINSEVEYVETLIGWTIDVPGIDADCVEYVEGSIRWTINVPAIDAECPEDIRLNYQNQTRAKAKEDLINLLKALGAKIDVKHEKTINATTKTKSNHNHQPSLFFTPVASFSSNVSNCNDELETPLEQLKK